MRKLPIPTLLRIALTAVFFAPVSHAQERSDAPASRESAESLPATTAPVLWQPSMNVFRRFAVAPESMYRFYGEVLGFAQLSTFSVGNGGVARFQAGAQELKLTRRVASREYQGGGVAGATGLRLLSFFFADEAALTRRFIAHGLPAPEFALLPAANH
ncbi:MAG TPA: hypothetical protein VFB99_10905, partial [Vicinamibacterales bacterium]|nr:hypothetical protein [Vicinamibacterales bacterium]